MDRDLYFPVTFQSHVWWVPFMVTLITVSYITSVDPEDWWYPADRVILDCILIKEGHYVWIFMMVLSVNFPVHPHVLVPVCNINS